MILAAFTGDSMTSTLIWVVGLGLIAYLLWWLIGILALPEPANKVARVLWALLLVVALIRLITRITGASF